MTDNMKIDLHTHSTASDGTFTPSELVRKAKENGICAVALTDHDTMDGVAEFKKACDEYGIEGIPGVEISARYSKEMHIIGLFTDEKDAEFKNKLDVLQNARETRNREILRLVKQNGFDITEEDIISQKNGATLSNTGRSHIAREMVKKGYAKSTGDAFAKYLKKGKPCYAERITYSPEESIQMIKKAGGTAILAHPVFITEGYDKLYSLMSRLKDYGIDGMECYYNCYSEKFSLMCEDICKKLNLVRSGGSDFHGNNKPDVSLGTVSTGIVPYSVLRNIKERMGL
ncbi:MAG: PHP domain-containing protein [Oscillospiraceae bacterium]|nr:PHP domain-containing protein [Oscillospiraceae bacterium]